MLSIYGCYTNRYVQDKHCNCDNVNKIISLNNKIIKYEQLYNSKFTDEDDSYKNKYYGYQADEARKEIIKIIKQCLSDHNDKIADYIDTDILITKIKFFTIYETIK